MFMSQAHLEVPAVSPSALPWSNHRGISCPEQLLGRSETLFCEGDEAKFLYEVVEGVMCNYRLLADGRRQVISFTHPGELLGLGHSSNYRFYSEAVCETRVRSIPRTTLMQHGQMRPDVGHCLLEFAHAELASLQEHQIMLGRKSAIEKVASFLLSLARRSADDDAECARFELPMTRADIADFLGLTIETVSRCMTKLRHMGVIDLPQSTTVIVRSIERLEDLAEGEDGVF